MGEEKEVIFKVEMIEKAKINKFTFDHNGNVIVVKAIKSSK